MKKLLMILVLALSLTLPALGTDRETVDDVTGYVALTFDDGPSGQITERLLDGLLARQAHATFFLCGYRMEEYPSALSRYGAEGHEVGVHSTVHTNLTELSPEEIHRDMQETADRICALSGVRPTLMRPPGGAYNQKVLGEAEQEGLSVILWSVDPRDWNTSDAQAVLHTMAKSAGDRDIILMHDMSASSVDAALRLVDDMEARGYRFVTVSELAALSGQTLEPGRVYHHFHS